MTNRMLSIGGKSIKRQHQFFTSLFWDSVATKLVATFISVKVWGLIVLWVLSSVFLVKGYIDGGEWVTVNGTVTSVIYGCREFFKIASVNQYSERQRESEEENEEQEG